MKTMNKKGSASQSVDDVLSLRDILDIFIYQWKWFALSVIVCLGIAYLYLMTKPNIYQRSAVMLVKDDSGTGNTRTNRGGTDALMQLNGVMMGSSVKNEVYILQSHQLMKEVVRELKLDVNYLYRSRLQTVRLYDVKPFTAQFDSVETQRPFSFKVSISGNNVHITDLVVLNEKTDFDKYVRFGDKVKTPAGSFTLIPEKRYLEQFEGAEITVARMTIEAAANSYGNALKASELDKESTLVGITYTDMNVHRAEDILNAVLEAYKRSIIIDKNRIAESTASFITERINIISKDLSKVEGQMASFKQANRLVDVKGDANQYLQQSSAARQRTIQLESQVSVVQYLLDDLRSNTGTNKLIPSLGGLTDAGIQGQIAKYNDAMLLRNRLVESAGENNQQIKQRDQDLDQMRATIIASTQAYLGSLNLQLQRARQEESGLSSNIAAVPQKEKELIDISRQQSIKETLYTYLLNKREETALQLAITEANIRIIETPFGSNMPISPRKKVIMLVALLLGIIIPFAFFHIRNLLNMSVRGRKDVEEYTSIPVLGEVPHRKEGIKDSEIIVADQKTDSINEAFRMLRFSLGFIQKDAHVIMFTSTVPGEGKTFISRNFAVTLGMTGKKVVLIDTDIRKRTQSKLAGNIHKEGLTSYLHGSTDDVERLIVKECPEYNVDMLPAGIVPPNPTELLMSDRLEQLIETLKKTYDYIVIDNVPAQVVADAGIVNRVADVTIYVIREGKIDRRYLPELERLYQEKKFNHLCIIINDAKIEKKRYGYGHYGYGHYGYGHYGYGPSLSESQNSKSK
ncbi:MAG: polysaccharide biosynthesis tyrosine autokinase [Bacteroidales bacterium]|nr:polysaccharide biosynthesis tyrosine autokinase [Bacteroidales bacterium]